MPERPPAIDLTLDALPADPENRRQTLADTFGRYLVWSREAVLARVRDLLDHETARAALGRVFREPYERGSTLAPEEREAVCALVADGVDRFAREILSLLSQEGLDLRLGDHHAVRFRLVLEVCDADAEDEAIVLEEPINRGGHRHFAGNWGRWLNRFTRPRRS